MWLATAGTEALAGGNLKDRLAGASDGESTRSSSSTSSFGGTLGGMSLGAGEGDGDTDSETPPEGGGGGGGAFLCLLDLVVEELKLSVRSGTSKSSWWWSVRLGIGGSKPTKGPPCLAI